MCDYIHCRTAIKQLVTACLLCFGCVVASGTDIDGFTEPYREIEVAAAEMGRIAVIHVKEGDRVKAGTWLASLDESEIIAAMAIAEAEMNREGKLLSAVAEASLQSETFSRLTELERRQHANPMEVARARLQKEIAEQQVRGIREDLAIRRLEFERLKAQLESKRLHSPIDGVVTEIYRDIAEFTSPSDPVVMKVVQLDPLLVVFAVPAPNSKLVKKDDVVSVLVEGVPTSGTVEFVSPTTDPQSATTRIRVRIPNPNEELQSGASCVLRLPSERTQAMAAK